MVVHRPLSLRGSNQIPAAKQDPQIPATQARQLLGNFGELQLILDQNDPLAASA